MNPIERTSGVVKHWRTPPLPYLKGFDALGATDLIGCIHYCDVAFGRKQPTYLLTVYLKKAFTQWLQLRGHIRDYWSWYGSIFANSWGTQGYPPLYSLVTSALLYERQQQLPYSLLVWSLSNYLLMASEKANMACLFENNGMIRTWTLIIGVYKLTT